MSQPDPNQVQGIDTKEVQDKKALPAEGGVDVKEKEARAILGEMEESRLEEGDAHAQKQEKLEPKLDEVKICRDVDARFFHYNLERKSTGMFGGTVSYPAFFNYAEVGAMCERFVELRAKIDKELRKRPNYRSFDHDLYFTDLSRELENLKSEHDRLRRNIDDKYHELFTGSKARSIFEIFDALKGTTSSYAWNMKLGTFLSPHFLYDKKYVAKLLDRLKDDKSEFALQIEQYLISRSYDNLYFTSPVWKKLDNDNSEYSKKMRAFIMDHVGDNVTSENGQIVLWVGVSLRGIHAGNEDVLARVKKYKDFEHQGYARDHAAKIKEVNNELDSRLVFNGKYLENESDEVDRLEMIKYVFSNISLSSLEEKVPILEKLFDFLVMWQEYTYFKGEFQPRLAVHLDLADAKINKGEKLDMALVDRMRKLTNRDYFYQRGEIVNANYELKQVGYSYKRVRKDRGGVDRLAA
ncbi:MAG: hypothetical protein WCT36_03445 [Candidatus Gracilibacteria bacterium]|jgi:hypothetical protein